METLKRHQGYASILQLLMVSVLSTAILGSLYMAFTSSQNALLISDAAMVAQDRARHALYDIGLDLRGSGNETGATAATHLRVHQPDASLLTYSGSTYVPPNQDGCPSLIYQVPLDSRPPSSGWGAIDPGAINPVTQTNPQTAGGLVWIHRAKDATGDTSGSGLASGLCAGPFLVRERVANAASLVFSTLVPIAALPSRPADIVPGSTRVIAARLDGNVNAQTLLAEDAFRVRALDDTGAQINWWGGISDQTTINNWRAQVKQVEIYIRTVQAAVGGRQVVSQQRMRIRLRNAP